MPSSVDPNDERQQQLIQEIPEITMEILQSGLVRSNWADLLSAAPLSVSILGQCFVAASAPVAMTMTLEKGGEKGSLIPHRSLRANLFHCGNVGQRAFMDAQSRMQTLTTLSNHICRSNGVINQILAVLDDPRTAKQTLRRLMGRLEKSSHRCKEEAEAMEKHFEDWKEFVLNLRLAVTDSETEKANLMKQNEEQRVARQASIAQRERAEEEARKAVSALQDAFEDARKSLQTAMSGVNQATESLGKAPDPESMPKINLNIPRKHKVKGGIPGQVIDFITGGTRAARRAEREYNEAQLRAGEIQKEFLRDHYEAARKRVEEARKNAAETQRIHMAIVEKQRTAEEELQKASEAIIESTLDLANLDTEKLTLTQIQDILKESLKALTFLKAQVTRIVDFYSSITLMVKDASEHACDEFLETIKEGLEDGGDETDTIERMELHEMQKRNVQETALRIQGYFSVIQEVSSIYVQVSKRHILPGISMIDELGLQDGPDPGENAKKRQVLDDYAYTAKTEIRTVAAAKQEEIKSGLWKRVRQFATQAKLLPPPTPEELTQGGEEEAFYPAE